MKCAFGRESWQDSDPPAAKVAELITKLGLDQVLAGSHDGKPVTFAKAFELVYGERLKL